MRIPFAAACKLSRVGKAKWRRAIVALVIFTAFPGATLAADPSIAPDIARILDRGTLIVASRKRDIPPFYYVDNEGNTGGIDVDIATDIANRLGVRLEYARIADTFNDLPGIVARREADVAIGYLSRTLRRSTVVRFTQPYLRLRQILIISRTKTASLLHGGERFDALDAADILIGVQNGSSYADFASERFPQAQVRPYSTSEAALASLLSGNLHALVVGEAFSSSLSRSIPNVPGYPVRKDWALYAKIIPMTGARDPIAMAVHRDDGNWLAWLDTYIADRQEDGSLERVQNQYFGTSRP